MIRLPLTYAVFFHAIIRPNTTNTQITINNILFTGESTPPSHHPTYFSSNIGCGYTSGAKNISKNIIDIICDLSIEELSHRVSLIKLQDIPATFNKLVDLIKILEISEELKSELLSEATNTDMTAFIAKVFQLSLKGTNERLRLDDYFKKLLHNPDMNQIIAALEPETAIKESATTLTATIPIEETISSVNASIPAEDKLLPYSADASYLEELEHLKTSWGYDENKPNPFKLLKSPHMYCQEIILPRDFDLFMQAVAPLIFKPSFINLDLADLHTAIGFDPDQKSCHPGKILLLDAICPVNDYYYLEALLPYIEGAQSCIASYTFGPNAGLLESSEISEIISAYLAPDAMNIFGVDFDESLDELCSVQIICLLEETTSNDSTSTQTGAPANGTTHQKSAETKTTIEIPSFMNK